MLRVMKLVKVMKLDRGDEEGPKLEERIVIIDEGRRTNAKLEQSLQRFYIQGTVFSITTP
jgi:hypothetical protein